MLKRLVNSFRTPLKLSQFKEIVTNTEQPFSQYNKKRITYIDDSYKEIGFIEYNNYSGKIFLVNVDDNYRYRRFGSQMIDVAINDMTLHGVKKAWLFTTKDYSNFFERKGFIEDDKLKCVIKDFYAYTKNLEN